MSEDVEKILQSVDGATRARVGGLAARGFSHQQIADVLLLKQEQVAACVESDEYKGKYAEVANEQIEMQLDLEDGWDAVETKAIQQVLTTMEYNRDPKYALMAASIANKAERRRHIKSTAPVLDASGQGGNGNVIVLQMNKVYINQVQKDEGHVIDVTPLDKNDQPKKRVDLPNPAQVEQLLAPVRQISKDPMLSELEKAFEDAGVMRDING